MIVMRIPYQHSVTGDTNVSSLLRTAFSNLTSARRQKTMLHINLMSLSSQECTTGISECPTEFRSKAEEWTRGIGGGVGPTTGATTGANLVLNWVQLMEPVLVPLLVLMVWMDLSMVMRMAPSRGCHLVLL
mmetsp:Transcript_43830/g.105729  ORF Transcript_43830/g.105729 Transcript_43830/m.105729 type:complete len:131 (+) Transcript_43830:187-579(+)